MPASATLQPDTGNISALIKAHTSAWIIVTEGWRLLRAGLRRRVFGCRTYKGDAREICTQIVQRCFHPQKRFFMTSPASYCEFWARDFGRSVPALLELGFHEEVAATFRYALGHYQQHNRFALVITPREELFDFPSYAPDGFALFMMGLAALGNRELIERHAPFLENEARRFAHLVIDPQSGLVRQGLHFSEAQDYAVRSSSCYTNCMCALLQHALNGMRLQNPLADIDFSASIERHFWLGDHYADDILHPGHPSGDAQILPFWCGVVENNAAGRQRLDTVLQWMDAAGLNTPLPTRYGISGGPARRMHFLHGVNPWQRDTVWTCLGLHLLDVLRAFDHPRFHVELRKYRQMVEGMKCFPEVLDSRTGHLHTGPFIRAEDSMLWASGLLCMLDNVRDEGVTHD